jgi:TRAP-type mannitol/chloroaromatic compound transport system permease large subunit
MGLLFIANGLYLGIDFPIAFAYIAVGLICGVYGIGIAVVRMKYRRAKSTGDQEVTASQ